MRIIVVSVFLFMLASCTGGIIGGLIPAPKFLKGHVTNNDIYISEKNEFSVKIPHPPSLSSSDSYEWRYTKVREIEDSNKVVGVIFGPAAFDHNLYHAVLIKNAPGPDIKDYVESVFNDKVAGRGRDMKLVSKLDFVHKEFKAFYNVYESDNAYLVLSLVADTNYFYVIESDISKNSSRAPSKEILVERNWDIFNRMFDSFQVLN